MDHRDVIRSQYQAALEMLKQAIAKCPESLWNDLANKVAFWRIAYHALFFTHLYLQPAAKDFVPWAKHPKDYELMGPPSWAPDQIPKIGEPYTILHIQQHAGELMERLGSRAGMDVNWVGQAPADAHAP